MIMTEYKRNCPKCGKELNYCTKYVLKYAIENNTTCVSCSLIGRPGWKTGKKMSQEENKKISDIIKKNINWDGPPD